MHKVTVGMSSCSSVGSGAVSAALNTAPDERELVPTAHGAHTYRSAFRICRRHRSNAAPFRRGWWSTPYPQLGGYASPAATSRRVLYVWVAFLSFALHLLRAQLLTANGEQ
jgi:hypothetical protein